MANRHLARRRDESPSLADQAPPTSAGQGSDAIATRRGRLEFLDALRGIAALTVAVQHIAEVHWVRELGFSEHWWRPGEFGVLVFFLCSGFIIPASMERRNDLVDFWIGRLFRLWPLYLVVLAAILLSFGLSARLAPPTGYRIGEDSLLNLTMFQVFSSRPLVIGASWTLGYELVFYLLVSVLFLLGLHRRSATTASLLLVASLGLGGLTTFLMLQTRPEHWWTLPVAGLLLLLISSRRIPNGRARLGAVLMGSIVVLAWSNRPHAMYLDLLLIGSMFVGTVMYRYSVGQLSRCTAAGVYLLAMALMVVTHRAWHIGYTDPVSGQTPQWWTEAATFEAAYVIFGLAFLLRHRSWPRVLTYLGTISYSVYLLHALVLIDFPPIPGGPWIGFFAMLATTLVGAVLTYHLVEKPSISLGRRVTAARRRRLERAAPAAPTTPAERSEDPTTADGSPTLKVPQAG